MRFSRKLLGVALLAIAALIIMGKFGLFAFSLFAGIKIWQVILAVILVLAILDGIKDRNFGGIVIPLAILLIVFKGQLGIPNLGAGTIIVVAILVTIAFGLIFDDGHKKGSCVTIINDNGNGGSSISNSLDGEYVYQRVSFNSVTKYIHSANFKKGEFDCRFGTIDLFLNTVEPAGNVVDIDIFNRCGTIILHLPSSWAVENSIDNHFGTVTEDGEHSSNPTTTVNLYGMVKCGTVIIKYV